MLMGQTYCKISLEDISSLCQLLQKVINALWQRLREYWLPSEK
jgi:hypothetical protein